MLNISIYGWSNKKRTALNKICPGDFFCFEFAPKGYGFGRIMSRNDLGHVAEFFGPILDKPEIPRVEKLKRLGIPIILDSYTLFDRKAEGEWRIVAHQHDYTAPADEPVRFAYGSPGSCKLVDIFDAEKDIDFSEVRNFPSYSPSGDFDVKEALSGLY